MLLVRTKLGMSTVHGIGLFADEFIAAGTPTWEFREGFDMLLSVEQIASLSPAARDQCRNYSYRVQGSPRYLLCSDDARFFNHADDPNTKTVQRDDGTYVDVAARDIRAGEELTCDYRTFDEDWRERL